MLLSASDLRYYYQPSKCELRIFLKQKGEKETPPGPMAELLMRLGNQLELDHLKTFPDFADARTGTLEERSEKTQSLIASGFPMIYQGVFTNSLDIGGTQCQITGIPDFLINESGEYVIRDSKIARRISDKDHPEIFSQLDLYGWLYEQTAGCPPKRLEVYNGTDKKEGVPYHFGRKALDDFHNIISIRMSEAAPYSPVGLSKCKECGFRDLCWIKAESEHNVAVVEGIDQNITIALREEGINTVGQLLTSYDTSSLSELKHQRGDRLVRVGKKAKSILLRAQSIEHGQEILLQSPNIPEVRNFVMFDLEGFPPLVDDSEKIYMWGMQVYGEQPSDYLGVVAGFERDDDLRGWEEFLAKAKWIFDKYGKIPFVHWHTYEKRNLEKYIERYNDRNGTAAEVLASLLDLHRISKSSVVLPIPSFSLKVIEKYIGFKRKQTEYGGDWSIVKYYEASESDDEELRDNVMNEILEYNKEDLAATWAVLQWLKTKAS